MKVLLKRIKSIFKQDKYKKIFKIILGIITVVFLYYIFMKFTIFITVDGSKYYSYLQYFNGSKSFGEWDTIRGPSFPLILHLFTSVFGDNTHGILLGFFIFYIILIYLIYIL